MSLGADLYRRSFWTFLRPMGFQHNSALSRRKKNTVPKTASKKKCGSRALYPSTPPSAVHPVAAVRRVSADTILPFFPTKTQ